MPKRTDPFAEFSEQILNSKKVTDLSPDAVVPEIPSSPAPEAPRGPGRPKTITNEEVSLTFVLDKEIHEKLRFIRYKHGIPAKQLVTEALNEYFKTHPELSR